MCKKTSIKLIYIQFMNQKFKIKTSNFMYFSYIITPYLKHYQI